MHDILVQFSSRCIDRGYISQEEGPWLIYGLEKRVTLLCSSIPFLLLGCLLSSVQTAVFFYLGVCSLRTYANGYHAKTIWGCLLASLSFEVVFLGIVPRLCNPNLLQWMLHISSAIILFFAPFNHPNMHLSKAEHISCRGKVRLRMFIQLSAILLLYLAGFRKMADGLLLGIVMTALMLVIAYINECWRKQKW